MDHGMDPVVPFNNNNEGLARELSLCPGSDITNNDRPHPHHSNTAERNTARRNIEELRPAPLSLPGDRSGGHPSAGNGSAIVEMGGEGGGGEQASVGEGENGDAEEPCSPTGGGNRTAWLAITRSFVSHTYSLVSVPLLLLIMYFIMNDCLMPYHEKPKLGEGTPAPSSQALNTTTRTGLSTSSPGLFTPTPKGLNVTAPTASGTSDLTLRNLTKSQRDLYLIGLRGHNAPAFGFIATLVINLVQDAPPHINRWAKIVTAGLYAVHTTIIMLPYHVITDPRTYTVVRWLLVAYWFFLCVPSFFAVVHWAVHVAAKQPGSKWWHVPACCLSLLLECINAAVIRLLTAFTTSVWFQWLSPFIFFFSALFTRRAAESSGLPLAGAARLSTVSLTMCAFFVRQSQSAEIDNIDYFLLLEVFYGVINIACRVTLYSRHAAWSAVFGGGKCSIRKRVRNPRAQVITTTSNCAESVFDSHFFVLHVVTRYMLFPSELSVLGLIGILSFGLIYQLLTNAATFYLISYIEHIPLSEFAMPSTSVKEVMWNLLYITLCSLWASWYLAPLSLRLWSPTLTDAELKP